MVCNYLDCNTRAKEDWFPNHNILMGKTPTEGAGQVRAISRLAFDEAVREGRMQDLEKAIEELYFLDGAAAPQAVRVMIVSTLAGGTGSGIVLPVALYIRNFLETRFRKNASVVRGFFLLPEIMFGGKSPEERASLCCNAYASIRELDAFMRRGDNALEGPAIRILNWNCRIRRPVTMWTTRFRRLTSASSMTREIPTICSSSVLKTILNMLQIQYIPRLSAESVAEAIPTKITRSKGLSARKAETVTAEQDPL